VEPCFRQRGDGEGVAHRWYPPAEIDSLRLHPGFAATWPRLIAELDAAGR
jgi:hypothetical protein